MFKDNKRLGTTDTLIGQGTHIDGKLTSEAGIRIEGEYHGEIECKGDVIIGNAVSPNPPSLPETSSLQAK